MMKKYRKTIIFTSLLTLLPIVVGLILWNRLPANMTTHFGADGNPDGWSGKAFAVFGLPLLLLAVDWLCIFFMLRDPKNKNQNEKAFGMVLWIMPLISCFVGGMIYAVALDHAFSPAAFMLALMGVLFLILGNYIPKCRQNSTIGIKVPWTLSDAENWYATHRFAGKVWVIGGVVMLAGIFVPEKWALWFVPGVLSVLVLLPVVYSYAYHRRQVQAGQAPKKASAAYGGMGKKGAAVSFVFLALILGGVIVLMFTGHVEVICGNTGFTVEASYYHDIEVAYRDITSVEYRESCPSGSRVAGYGSAQLELGRFRNEEFGNYTRYGYTRCDAGVVLCAGDDVLVLTGKDAAQTQAIYEEILAEMEDR